MKKILTALGIVVCAASVFAQGQMVFNTRVTGTIVVPVYMPQLADPLQEVHGQSAAGFPVGTTVYTGGVLPATSGARFTAQLFGGPLGTDDAALAPMLPTTTFRTATSLAGFVNPPATVALLDSVAPNTSARMQMRVWDNQGGTVTSWADAVRIAAGGNLLIGDSLSFDTPVLGGGSTPPANLIGLTSFNLHFVPEPSVIALGVLGVGALVLFRRRKN